MKRRSLALNDFDALAGEAERLGETGYEKVGRWNLAQACEHLAIVMEGSLDGFAFPPASWFWRRVLGPVLIRVTVWTDWMPEGLPCPDPSFAPGGRMTDTEAVARFRRACQRVRDWPGEFHAHPILGRIKPAHWKRIHLVHARHHLSFLLPAPGAGAPAPEACVQCNAN